MGTSVRNILLCSASVLLVTAAIFAHAGSCENAAELAYRYAIARDNGMTSKELGAYILKMRRSGDIDDRDAMQMSALAGFVFSDLHAVSPTKIRNQFLMECK